MQYALSSDGLKIQATKGVSAVCPNCRSKVIAKCGAIKIHHWAHAADDCDPWYEPETEWHRAWKAVFDEAKVEVPMGEHRADVRSNGLVIELQNSNISPREIEARERFYGDMIWIVNAERFAERLFLMKKLKADLFTFKWKHMKASWRFAKRPVYLDLGNYNVRDLLGAESVSSSEFYSEGGQLESYGHTSIVRYRGPASNDRMMTGYFADDGFASLPERVLSCSVLKIYSLHENGRGSAYAVSRWALYRLCGADPSKTLDLSAFA